MHIRSFGVLKSFGVVLGTFQSISLLFFNPVLSMSPPALSNKFCTVDAMHKIGSYPVPREGQPVAMMDKIMSQELQGVIIFDKTKPGPRDKYLGFLIDKIFADFTADLLSFDELKVLWSAIFGTNPRLAESYPDDEKTPLYNTSTHQWNWPLSASAIACSLEDNVPSQEHHTALFFNVIGQALKPKIETQVSQQCWLGTYSTHHMPGNIDGAGAYHCKPDIILIEKSDQVTNSISWMSPTVIAEHSQSFKPSLPLVKTIHMKVYLIFLDQPWRHFVLALSIAKKELQVHFYDHSGTSISPAFNIETDPGHLVTILASVMFGSWVCIGFNPTINVRPVQSLQVSWWRVVYDSAHVGAAVPKPIPEESEDSCLETSSHAPQPLPDSVSVDSIALQLPTFIPPPHDDNHLSTANSTSNSPAPIGEICVRDVCYEILEVLFSSGGFLGQGTVIYLARCGEELYIIKDHWVENPLQEAKMMKQMKGVCGVPKLIDSWTVKILPGVVNVTSWYCSEELHIHMKSIWMHVQTSINLHGCQLSKFRTKHELVQCLRDILISKYSLSFTRSLVTWKSVLKEAVSREGHPSLQCQPIQYHNWRFGGQYPGNAYLLGICSQYHCHIEVQWWGNGQ